MTDDKLENLIKPLVNIYSDLELELIKDIAVRLNTYDGVKGTLKWNIDKLEELGGFNKDNLKLLSKYSKKSQSEIKRILKNVGYNISTLSNEKNIVTDETLKTATSSIYNSVAIKNIVDETIKETNTIMETIQTKAIESAKKEYMQILTDSYIKVSSGVYSYDKVIKEALNKLAKEGITGATYTNGTKLSLESTVRRDILTKCHQLSAEIEIQKARDSGTNLVYVTQHLGARIRTKYTKEDYEVHCEWQGKAYMLDGSNEKYDNFYEKTGYGELLGLCGVNCRHHVFATDESKTHPVPYDEEENEKAYILSQEQRAYERKEREYKKRIESMKILDDKEELKKIRQKKKLFDSRYDSFLKENNLQRDYNREYIDKEMVKIEQNKKSTINNVDYVDVTKEWLNNATPNNHKVEDRQYFEKDGVKYQIDGKDVVLDYSIKEKEVAEWLENTFGGEIYMLPRINNPQGIQTADYLFENEYWDLKEITGSGKHTLDSAIKKKKSQSNNFIFDISNSKMTLEMVSRQSELIYKSKDRKWIDKIIVKQNKKVIIVYKRIKKRD